MVLSEVYIRKTKGRLKMRSEEEIREKLEDAQIMVNNEITEASKDHLKTSIHTLKWVLQE